MNDLEAEVSRTDLYRKEIHGISQGALPAGLELESTPLASLQFR